MEILLNVINLQLGCINVVLAVGTLLTTLAISLYDEWISNLVNRFHADTENSLNYQVGYLLVPVGFLQRNTS